MTTENDTFTLKVNGEELQMAYRFVVAHDILELAEKNGIIHDKPDRYILKNLLIDDRVYGQDEEIDLEKDNQFITIQNSPTPVA